MIEMEVMMILIGSKMMTDKTMMNRRKMMNILCRDLCTQEVRKSWVGQIEI
jgi:hypothetical protein